LGEIWQARGDVAQAQNFFNKALKLYRQIGSTQGKARQLGNLGHLQYCLGNLEAARDYFQQSLEQHRQAGYKLGEAGDLGSLALVYEDLGNWEKAFHYHQEAYRLDETIGYLEGQATDLGNLGGLYFRVGKLNEARQCHERALTLHRALGQVRGEAKDLGNLALVAYKTGDLERARQYGEMALACQQQLRSPEGEAGQMLNLAALSQTMGNLEAALDLQNRALEIIRHLSNPDLLARALAGRGETWTLHGDVAKTYGDFKEAIAIIDDIRGRLLADEYKTGFLRGGKMSLYGRMVKLLWYDLKHPGEAFAYAERARSRALLDLLAISLLRPHEKVESSLLAEEQETAQKMRVLQGMLQTAKTEAQQRAIAAEMAVAHEKYLQILDGLTTTAPEYVTMRLARPLDWSEIVTLLAPA